MTASTTWYWFTGGGREEGEENHENWSYLDRKGKYFLGAERLSESKISPEEIAITRTLYWITGGGENIDPDAESIACIKEAMQEYGRSYMFNLEHYKSCQITLIDARTGKEI